MENSHKKEVFCRYIHRNGQIVYPKKSKFFHFWVDEVTSGDDDLDSSAASNDVTGE